MTIRTSADGRRVVSWVGRHIIEEELPVERQERVVQPAMAPFSPAQTAAIEKLMAERIAELGLDRQEVKA